MKNKKNGKLKFLSKKILMGLLLGTAILVPMIPRAYALPSEGTYASSNASTVTTSNNIMSITGTTENNVVNWNTFSIANGETVNFTDSNNYLNLVNGVSKSTIDGVLSGAGDIYLVNPNGIIFGSNASINVGSLIASTREITDTNITDFENGINPITNSTVDSVVGNITNLGNIKANSVVLEGNEVIIQNAKNVTIYDGEELLNGENVTIKAADDITVGHEVTTQVDLDETTGITLNAADYKNATISSSGYIVTDLVGSSKDITEAFLVEDVYDLQNMNSNLSANYLLANDIDASETSAWSSGFTPVGSENEAYSYFTTYYTYEKIFFKWVKVPHIVWHTGTTINVFSGNFNGTGNVISGLVIDKTGQDNVGLFGYVENTEIINIKNVGLENANIKGRSSVGGLVGYVDGDIEINNSYNTGSISGVDAIGGLVGGVECSLLSHGKVDITDSYNTGIVKASDNKVGGLVGGGVLSEILTGEELNFGEVEISNSYNIGSISGSDKIGGLVGGGESTIVNSYNTGIVSGSNKVGGLVGIGDSTISNSYNTGSISGSDKVGGLVGNGNTTISNSYNTGNIIGEDDYIGGLVGSLIDGLDDFGNTKISNSYNIGNISGSSYIGGLVGCIENYLVGGVEISNSYNTGIVYGRDNYIGGLVGYSENFIISKISINNSYNTGNVTGEDDNVGGLVGRSKNFSTSKIKINNSYNIGSVNGGTENVGGLFGDENTIISDSYYATTDISGNEINQYNVGDVYAKTYAEMLDVDTYAFKDDIDTTGGQDKTWRMYKGYTTPMLKTFMETVQVNVSENTYNGEEQTGVVSTLDGITLSSNISGNMGTNAGIYTIYSDQQGYDLVSSVGGVTPVYTINPKELTISMANATMTYGSLDITWDNSLGDNEPLKLTGFISGEGYNNIDVDEGDRGYIRIELESEGILGGLKTNNVGTYDLYTDSITENLKNYTITNKSVNDAGINKLSIIPKKLTVNMNDATMTYGYDTENWADNSSSEKGVVTSTKYNVSGFAYDEATDSSITNGVRVATTNNALDTNDNDSVLTKNAGNYDIEGLVSLNGLGNYTLTSTEANKGSATVNRATLTLTADEVNVYTVDDTKIQFSGNVSGFVNGDGIVEPTFALELTTGENAKEAGEYAVYGKVGDVEVGNYFDNYTVIQADGNITAYKVTKATGVVIPDVIDETVQEVLDGEDKEYHETMDAIERSIPPSGALNGTKPKTTQKNQPGITNNGGASGIGAATYDQKTDSIIIYG